MKNAMSGISAGSVVRVRLMTARLRAPGRLASKRLEWVNAYSALVETSVVSVGFFGEFKKGVATGLEHGVGLRLVAVEGIASDDSPVEVGFSV